MSAETDALKQKGLKITPQRLAIYRMLLGTTAHPSAETIYSSLAADYPAMSLATVYKTLASFKDSGLVQELATGQDSLRYDANVSQHAHFICSVCGEVLDLDYSGSPESAALCEKHGHSLHFEQLYLFGKCCSCLKQYS